MDAGSLPSIRDGNGKVRASQDAPVTTVALNGFCRYWKTILISNQHVLRTQFNTNIAPFAPLVKYLDGYSGIFAFFLSYSMLNLRLLG